jgi:hypothetical protein
VAEKAARDAYRAALRAAVARDRGIVPEPGAMPTPPPVDAAPDADVDPALRGIAAAATDDDEIAVPGVSKPAAKPEPEPAPEEMRICPNCGTANAAARRFCMKCGTKLPEGEVVPPVICPNCSTPNASTRRFCMKCGTSLVDAAPPDPDAGPWWRRS